MGDAERSELASQFSDMAKTMEQSRAQSAKEIRDFRKENKEDNAKIIERLDGKVSAETGIMTGGICATLKDQGRMILDHDDHITHMLAEKTAAFSWVKHTIWASVVGLTSAAIAGIFLALAEKFLK